mmetsp:Transcript_29277/g.41732  ORF Transcript_29277/g.41732 Transcript_29277/m.41732 type:complete len:294 (+) Transcript_29277:497-1378(+)
MINSARGLAGTSSGDLLSAHPPPSDCSATSPRSPRSLRPLQRRPSHTSNVPVSSASSTAATTGWSHTSRPAQRDNTHAAARAARSTQSSYSPSHSPTRNRTQRPQHCRRRAKTPELRLAVKNAMSGSCSEASRRHTGSRAQPRAALQAGCSDCTGHSASRSRPPLRISSSLERLCMCSSSRSRGRSRHIPRPSSAAHSSPTRSPCTSSTSPSTQPSSRPHSRPEPRSCTPSHTLRPLSSSPCSATYDRQNASRNRLSWSSRVWGSPLDERRGASSLCSTPSLRCNKRRASGCR